VKLFNNFFKTELERLKEAADEENKGYMFKCQRCNYASNLQNTFCYSKNYLICSECFKLYIKQRGVSKYLTIKDFVEGKTMNALELGAQKIVVSLLTDIHNNHLAIMKFITLGKVSDPTIETINKDILKGLDILKPIINEADALIPSGMPILSDVLSWAKEMINALDPDAPK